MLRKKHSEPAQPDGQQALLEFETPADQPGKKDPKQFFKKNWKKITAVVCVAAVAAAVLLPRKSAKPAQADVYYYNASAKTVWIYSRKAAGRITAVSPSASAPTSVTVAGTSYTIANSSVASQLSSLNGGGVGQVVTLLLGMNNEAVAVLTGEQADEVFYGVVQTAARSLVEENGADVRYYTTNEAGQIDRLILNDATGDLWTYGVLDDVKNLINTATDTKSSASSGSSGSTSASDIASDVAGVVLPSTGDLLWGLVDGSIGSTLWESVTGSTDKLASYLLKLGANNTTGTLSTVLNYFASGASYVCYVNGQQVIYQTSTKYPVLAGGVAIGKSTSGTVKSMRQLLPAVIDKVGAASVMSGGKKYETADDMQVYLWYKGTYYPTTLSQVNSEDYSLIGWYDANGSSAGGKIRVLIAVKKD